MRRDKELEITEWILRELGSRNKKTDFDMLASSFGGDICDLRDAVRMLTAQGRVLTSAKGKLFLPGTFGYLTGRLDVKRGGFAFLLHENGDVFVSADNKNGAMHGDLVAVRLIQEGEADRRREGEVKGIIEQKQQTLVGTLNGRHVIPDDERLEELFIAGANMGGATTGQKVVAEITSRANGGQSAKGRITEVLDTAGAADAELKSIIRQHGLPDVFPHDVESEALRVSKRQLVMQGREDFRETNIITIDGADAKDLDDAVSIRRQNDGYELCVHIADVAHYVAEGSKLDREAFKRGTSVYLADTVLPMLPKALSNGACSLSEGQERLTLSCIMELDEKGNVLDARVCQSVIRSKHRMTYSDVNKMLTGGHDALEREYADILGDLKLMGELAAKMRHLREEKGSIDFEIDETAFSYDAQGHVIGIGSRERGEAEKLIEEFMLAANKAVAEMYFWREIPFVYRVHEQPDEEKMRSFAAFYANYGKMKGKTDSVHPKTLQGILNDVRGMPHENIVSQIMLRSLKKAEYSPECKGHFGLAFEHYCHFTSPIRRYPDLAVHRIIKKDLEGKLTAKAVDALNENIAQIAQQSSLRERVALEAERDVDDVKRAEYMHGKEGQVYEGVVSGVSRNVIFVQLDNTVEGVIPLSSLRDDYYVYIEKMYCVVGERKRKKISLGDAMRVRVESVSVYPPRVEFVPEG